MILKYNLHVKQNLQFKKNLSQGEFWVLKIVNDIQFTMITKICDGEIKATSK